MKLMVSDLKALVLLVFPLVYFGGMLQILNFWAVGHAFYPIPEPTTGQLMLGAMVYPMFLTAFFRVDGEKVAFQFSTVMFISAVMGLVVFPTLLLLITVIVPGFARINPIFNGAVVLFDVAVALWFLFHLSETDLHKIPARLIWGSLLVLEFTAMTYILYQNGTLGQIYRLLAAKAQALMKMFG